MESNRKFLTPKSLSVVAAVACLLLSVFLSGVVKMDPLQIKAIGFLAAALILWISDAIPMAISTLVLLFLLPLFGMMEYNDVVNSFGTGTALFIMASSGITVVIAKSNIPHKIAEFVFGKMSKHPVGLIYLFGFCVTIFSGFVSSLATCTLFTALAATALSNLNLEKGKSNFAKALMLTIPACAGVGGFISPAGTPANILVLDILKDQGIIITFGKWCAIGFPICLLASFVFLTFLILIFKPEKIDVVDALSVKRFQKNDYIVLVTVLLVILGWFLSGFVSALNITLVAVVGLAFFFVPSVEIISFDEFSRGVNWNLVFTMGSVSVLMTAIANTGLITNITKFFTPFLTATTLYVLLFGLSLLICFIRAFVPTTTAVIALLLPMLMSVSEITGVNCVVLLLIASFWAATALLLVLGLLQPMAFVLVIAIVLSAWLARRMAKRVVEPLNQLNLENPMENDAYSELSPLLHRIHTQHQEIGMQMQALKHKQDEFEQITGNMKEALVLLDNSGRIVSINPAAKALFGVADQCVGKDFLTIDRKQDMRQAISQAKKEGYAYFHSEKMDGNISLM